MRNCTKCEGCIFLSAYEDMGASTPVCVREGDDFLAAIRACENSAPCPWHITRTQVKQMQSTPVQCAKPSGAPGLSSMDAEKVFEKIQNSKAAADSFNEAMKALAEAAAPMGRAIYSCAKALRQALEEAEEPEK